MPDLFWAVLHQAWHVVGGLAIGHTALRWWWDRQQRKALAQDAARRLSGVKPLPKDAWSMFKDEDDKT